MKRALAAPMCLLGIACHRAPPLAPPDASPDGGKAVGTSEDAAASPGDAEPERACHGARTATLAGFTPGEDLEFGEAVRAPSYALVGVLRSSSGGARASVARVEGQAATLIDLGVAVGEVPPPQPFLRGIEVFAAGYARPGSAFAGAALPPRVARPLTVFRLNDVAEPLVTLMQISGESPSFDVIAAAPGGSSGALLAWDEDAEDAHRGLIRVAVLSQDLRAVVHSVVASPETTDAERPAIAARGSGGYWLAWVARKAEPPRDAGPELEGPGEDRAFRWVELAAIDADAKPVGSVRRLTSATGHVSAFSMAMHGDRLDLYAGEDDEPTDGAGGAILHVAVDVDGLTHTAPLVSSGTARGGTPTVVWQPQAAPGSDDNLGYLMYVDIADRSRLVPLDRTGSSRSTATLEPDLDDARLLAAEPSGELLVATPRPDGAATAFRWLRCVDLHRDAAPAPFP
jgi:hypothetical protein